MSIRNFSNVYRWGSSTIKPFPFKDRDVINVTIVGGLEMFRGKLSYEVSDAQKHLLDFLN
jgi:hypothetical protein